MQIKVKCVEKVEFIQRRRILQIQNEFQVDTTSENKSWYTVEEMNKQNNLIKDIKH